jgi:hypothetical protein
VVTTYLDGQTESLTGTAQPSQYYDYSISNQGYITTTQHTASATSGAWQSNQNDWLGRNILRTQPGSKATEEIQQGHEYNSLGQLEKTTATGINSTRYTYDDLGALSLSGLDADNSGSLEPASLDSITKAESDFVKMDDGWWLSERAYAYPKDNSDTAILIAGQVLMGLMVAGITVAMTWLAQAHSGIPIPRRTQILQEAIQRPFLERIHMTPSLTPILTRMAMFNWVRRCILRGQTL